MFEQIFTPEKASPPDCKKAGLPVKSVYHKPGAADEENTDAGARKKRKENRKTMYFFTDAAGRPFIPLGLQVNNSSTGDPEMLDREFLALRRFGGNLLEAPIYWFRTEKEEGQFDFSDVDDLLARARKEQVSLILLWFGFNKNGHPNYAPEWVKLHPETYRVAKGPDGAHVASLSPLCEATMQADARAFSAFMAHLKEADGEQRTVIAVQVENEIGLADTDLDYSEEALEEYRKPVPGILDGIELEDSGVSPSGNTWKSRFGRHAHEAFMAWKSACYVETVAAAGKAVYPLPMTVNVMLGENSFEEAGICYNSGAAVGRVLDIYKAAAPSIDLLCPDMYVPSREQYLRVIRRYRREDNPLFIPECSPSGIASAMNMTEAFGDHGCIGLAGFGGSGTLDINGELLPEAAEVAMSMKAIRAVSPLLVRFHGTGRIHAIIQQEFMDRQYLRLENYHVEAKFINRLPGRTSSRINTHDPANRDVLEARGRAILVQAGEHEFFLAGCGVRVDFRHRPDPLLENSFPLLRSRQNGTLNFLSVEEGHFEGDEWVCDRNRNGDESNFELYVHRGEIVRIRLNPAK